jgi:hypothetical protein
MDYAERLKRSASALEERYVKLLYTINGGDPDEARQALRDRLAHRLKVYDRWQRRRLARDEEARRALGANIMDTVAKTDPTLALQATIHGCEVPNE